MYYPVGWHKVLKVDFDPPDSDILSIQANHERELFFILTTKSLHIWFSKPAVEIVAHRRSKESIEKIGLNVSAVWKTDSNVIVVSTSRDQLVFYQIRRRVLSTGSSLLLQNTPEGGGIYRLNQDTKNLKNILVKDPQRKSFLLSSTSESIPPLTIFSFGKLDLSAIGVSCLLSAEEELIVGARNGDIYGIHWDGNVDDKFPWSISNHLKSGDYVSDLKFSSVLSGFAIVFSSGRIAYMPLKNPNKEPGNIDSDSRSDKLREETYLRYLDDVNNAVCTEINHKYRLAAFGLKDSKILVCNVNDLNSSFIINHKLELQQNNSALVKELGAVESMQYSPDNIALVTSWEKGHLAIWSVFGSLLFCSNQWRLESRGHSASSMRFPSVAWGQEGFNLWLCITNIDVENDLPDPNQPNEANNQDCHSTGEGDSLNSKTENLTTCKDEIIIVPLAHSSLPSSPHLTCSSDSVILISEDRIYIGPSEPQKAEFDYWLQVDIPPPYLTENYPIRYAVVDRECKNLAIAGNKGFALYSIEGNEWKFFAKKSHEESFSVCGDLIFWRDYIVTSCINLDSDNCELRAYLLSETLSNNQLITLPTRLEIIRMSIFENRLLVLYRDGTLSMFMLSLRKRPSPRKPRVSFSRSNSIVGSNIDENANTRTIRADSIMSLNYPLKKDPLFKEVILQISPIENLVISNLQANAYCISAIALTRLHFKNNRSDDSILLNACGKLFLLERETPHSLDASVTHSELIPEMNGLSIENRLTNNVDMKSSLANTLTSSLHFASASLRTSTIEPSALSNVTFRAVSVIATNVEQFWISPEIAGASEMSYFKKSLWLSRGGVKNFLQVWLPLLNDKNDPPTDLYVPERIMLPIRCDIYPLSIRSSTPDIIEPDDAIVLGAESDILYRDSDIFTNFPFCTVKRQCRVYLHRVLRELLLNQHLGYYAKKIAESCQSLPYFSHCFELLLHEVLEEEATSPVPLPDPMLPQIVKFIKEFPVYLETVVHCARKSELSMWSHLFDEKAVGNPRRLFQECLEKHKLDTAASCLIILQGLDRNIVSQKMVKELIKAAKDDEKYNYLIDDLENFLNRAELDYSTNNSNSTSPTT